MEPEFRIAAEGRGTGMTNAEKIKSMTDEQLNRFLWIWGINSIASFLEHGGVQLMNAKEQAEWLAANESAFVCTQTRVGEDFVFGQDFNLKEGAE